MSLLPSQAEYIVIGGGIIGCSTAYHLAKFGARDVMLLERKKLTSGTTFHAAGLVGQLRSSANITRLIQRSVELYRTLESETGLATGWKMNGGLRLACNAERMTEIKRQATTAHSFGLDMHLLTPREALKLWPLMDISDVVGAAFLPTDGQANPSDITLALAKGARMRGVRIFEDTEVTKIEIRHGRVAAVRCGDARIACEKIILCAGQWSADIGRAIGLTIPLQSVEHQYIITEPCGAPSNLPTLRDPDRLIYYKEEVGGLAMGGYEPNPIAWGENGIPKDFHFTLIDAKWDHFEQIMVAAVARTPVLEKAGVKTLINGPEAFTPDGNFILGEAPELGGLFVGCGFNAFGIASAGGAGWALAQWVLSGEPPLDLWPVDIRRFSPVVHADRLFVRRRTLEAYAKHYAMAWPHDEYESGRPLLTSRLYARLKAKGAVFGSKLGWERPNWFAKPGIEAVDIHTFGRPNWFPAVAQEHRAARETAALFDQSSFAKFEVTGPGAKAALSWLCAGDISRPPGHVTYCQMLDAKGGIRCDLTVSRLTEDRFYLVTGTGFRTHDQAWIKRHLPAGPDVAFADVTERFGCLALMGPNARDILAAACRDDVSNAAFPYLTCRRIEIAGFAVIALRVTYVGELGYELHIPIAGMEAVYDALWQGGKTRGLVDAGYRAIESLRLEKGYRAWGADINADSNPFEAGLGFAVKLKSGIDFLGRDALIEQTKRPLTKILTTFTTEDPSIMLFGRETIFRNGEQVGYLTSGGFGHTIGKPIGLGYVRCAKGINCNDVLAGAYELEVASVRVKAQAHLTPLYDPRGVKVKA